MFMCGWIDVFRLTAIDPVAVDGGQWGAPQLPRSAAALGVSNVSTR